MTATAALALVLATAAGFGIWFPLRSIGGRLFLGAAAVPILMNLLHFSAAVPLAWAGIAVAALAVPGLLRIALRLFSGRRSGGTAILPAVAVALANPAVALPLAAAVVMMSRGLDSYSLYSWDEFASWVYWPREAFAADTFFAYGMNWQSLLYTQGWPMAMLYPQTFFERFEPVRAVAVAAIWHAALLGLVYDALRAQIRRAAPATAPTTGGLVAWMIILALLAVEASWTLLPQLLLIEKPQIYMIAAAFSFLLLGVGSPKDRVDRQEWCILAAGCALAAGYLIKVTVLGAVPAAMLAVAMMQPSPPAGGAHKAWHAAAYRLLWLLAPVAAVYAWWAVVRPFDGAAGCLADPFALSLAGGDAAGRALDTASRLAVATGGYLQAYKLPLTGLALCGVVAGLFSRRSAPVAAGVILYGIVYMISLLPLYAWCYGASIELDELGSLQRYLRVPLRFLHLLGPVLLVVALAGLATRPPVDRLARGLSSRAGIALLALLVGTAGIHQFRALDASVRNVVERDREPAHSVAEIRSVERDVRRLLKIASETGLESPGVTMIAQGKQGFELRIGRYHTLADRRSGGARFRLSGAYSWGPEAANQWMQAAAPDELARQMKSQDILWPLVTDPWIRDILGTLVGDSACAARPEDFFLLRTPDAPAAFRCIPKDRAVQ